MPKRVLDVGQCSPDHGSISGLLNEHFDVQIDRAHSHAEAMELVAANAFDLILINRILDADGSEGMKILRDIKAADQSASVPVMIVSNYADAQQAAVSAGAIAGFGKAELHEPAVRERLAAVLA